MTRSGAVNTPFSDRLAALVEERVSQLVLGLDPDPAVLWPAAVEAVGSDFDADDDEAGLAPARAAALAVSNHCQAAIDAAGPHCVAVKLQLACFERLGAPGWAALTDAVRAARAQGLLVIADGKRGDVPVTATAYAQALIGSTPSPWGEIQGLGADAITVNPLLGGDSLQPFTSAAAAAGAGVFVLCRTSNPGAASLQDVATEGGQTVSERLASAIAAIGSESIGEAGLSSIGAVVGATAPGHLARLRDLMPAAVLLLPGVGAQGGAVAELSPAFAHHRAGGLVTVSRSLVNAWRDRGGDPATACAAAAGELREQIWSVASAGA